MKLKCGILGATGTVGQRFVELLEGHKIFQVVLLGASGKSAGSEYKDVVKWKLSREICEYAKKMKIVSCDVGNFLGICDFVFSGLPSEAAQDIERDFANSGLPVFTNARAHRMDLDVPIVVPSVNPEHIELVRSSKCYKTTKGFIVANANCSSTGLAIALAPLVPLGIEKIFVVTLQAISGAGYPGVASMDILNNVIPNILGEEDKLEEEPLKILGRLEGNQIRQLTAVISATTHRVPVTEGHTLAVSVKLSTPDPLTSAIRAIHNFENSSQVGTLPSSPPRPIILLTAPDRPQPNLDRFAGNGMTTSLGQIRRCNVLDVKFSVVTHNTIAGAAGGSIQNAELAVARKLL